MLADSRRFLRNFIRNPRATGALTPATDALSRSVATAVHQAYLRHAPRRAGDGALDVMELGAGTGALTRRISPLRPMLVEQDSGWAGLLRHRFPQLEIREQCASQALRELQRPVGLVSSIPLLNNPQSGELRALIAERYATGLIRFCVLYTYGWADPLAGSGFRHARRAHFVARSFPPASVWLYE